MNAHMHANRSDASATSFMPGRSLLLQRQCACGSSAGTSGECATCANKRRVQAKLSIGANNDPMEQEADRVADQVLAATTDPTISSAPPRIQRFTGHSSGENSAAPASVDSVLASTGRPLEPVLRQDMEQRFGHDFSRVRVHTDAAAEQSARDVNAHAYTVGHNMVFGASQFAPRTHEGRRLIAHELTHVVQQTSAERVRSGQSNDKPGLSSISATTVCQGVPPVAGIIQRDSSDFKIRGIAPDDASNSDMIFFDLASALLDASERAKAALLAIPAGRNLTLNGFASEEGSDAYNDSLINARLDAVEAALVAVGHTGARTRVNLRASSLGQIDYRHMRSVEVLPTPVGSAAAPSTQSNCSAVGAIQAPCGTAFANAFPSALDATVLSAPRLADPTDATANGLVSQLFSGVSRAAVDANMRSLAAQVSALPTQHQCHSDCDAGCGRPAYQTGTGIGAGGALMTLCPDFLNNTNVMDNAQTLVHEAAHGTAGLAADDIAYSNTRQIAFLSPADAIRNTDSYVLLAFELAFPGTMTIGPSTPDAVAGMTTSEENSARRAVAWVESWLNYGDFDTEILYDTIHRSVPPALAWDTSQSGDDFNRETMQFIAPVFGLTNPGASAPFVPPTVMDKVRVSAIHDRYDQMYSAINWRVLNVSKGVAGAGGWQSLGASLPRLGQDIVLDPAFFAMSAPDQVKDLVLLMATAMSGISSGFRPKYVDAMNQIRNHRGLGP